MNIMIDGQWDAQNISGSTMLCGGRLYAMPADMHCVHFHVEAIRVKTVRGLQCGFDSYAQERLDDMGHLDPGDGHFHTIRIPERKGKWVLNILPGKD